MDARFDAVDVRFNAMDQKMDARFNAMDSKLEALLSAISESRAQAELTSMRVVGSLSERVTALESQRH